MKELSQVLWGILAALISIGIIFGSFALSMAESDPAVALILEIQPISTNFSLRSTMVGTPVSGRPTLTPSPPGPVTTASSPTATATFPLPANCPHPGDWVSVIIEPGDTVERLANAYSTKADDITRNNCLLIDTLITGTILWLPPVEKIGKFNQPAKSCGPPDIWVFYLVKPGDTLFYLSVTTGATVSQLQWANCLESSTVIRVGQSLYLPFVPEPTSTHTQVIPPTIVSTPTATPTSANNSPTANPQSVKISADTPEQIILTGTDLDGDTLSFSIVGNPEHGELSGNPPLFSYTPDLGFTGADSFSFIVTDGQVESSPAIIDISVINENLPPIADPLTVNTTEGTPIGIVLTGSDPDGDSLTYSIVSQPAHGMVTGNPPLLIYLADPGFTGIDSLTFTVFDGEFYSAPAEVQISISAVNTGFQFSNEISLKLDQLAFLSN